MVVLCCCDGDDLTGGRDRIYGRFKPEAYATENEGKESQTPTSILMTVIATSGEQVLVTENGDVICDDNFFNSSSLGFIQFDRFLPAAMWWRRPSPLGSFYVSGTNVGAISGGALPSGHSGGSCGHAMVRAILKPAKKGSPKRAKRNRRGSSEPTSTNTTPP